MTLLTIVPQAFVTATAGIGLLATFGAALTGALRHGRLREGTIVTFSAT